MNAPGSLNRSFVGAARLSAAFEAADLRAADRTVSGEFAEANAKVPRLCANRSVHFACERRG